jgi:hypothetical protein
MEQETVDAPLSDAELNEDSKDFVNNLIDRLLQVCNALLPEEHELRPYQIPFARRIFDSLIRGDGADITALFSRQSGKSEALALVTATAMILFPKLARIYPYWFGKYRNGFWVGAFAPVEEQANNLFERIVTRLTSEEAQEILADPDINERILTRGRTLKLKSGSLVRRTTCHPKATIEGRTYHLILIDEAQGADEVVVNKKIGPMGAAVNATMVYTGTCDYRVGVFYSLIKTNQRLEVESGRRRKNHFQVDWKEVSKYNPDYKKSVEKERNKLGEDSDEFRLSYRIQWILEKGMFTTSEKLDALGDTSMQSVVHAYHRTPVVAGIDCGRKQDRTIVTVVFVDWDNPDQFGLYHHHVLNWLDLEGIDWEEQYYQIVEFLSNYNIWKIGIDVGGLGDAVAQRLKVLMPDADIVELGSSNSEQSVRWKHLNNLIEHEMISWPAGAKVRKLRKWQRFRQEMEDLLITAKGPYFLAEAPKSVNAHDDYPDSLSMACVLSVLEDETGGQPVEVWDNVFYRREKMR